MYTQLSSTRKLTYGAIFIALMAVGANATAMITIGTVPLTFQSVIAILSGIVLGKRTGSFAIIGYVLLGLAGAPIFAGFAGGPAAVSLPTFGFILSFIFTAFAAGWAAENFNRTRKGYTAAGGLGLAVNYVVGTLYLYFYLNTVGAGAPLWGTAAGMVPFLIKDILLVIFAGGLAYQLQTRGIIKTEKKNPSAA
ncbi:biotin transporter BioY [Alkalicoccus chagannorensis]|uniref:biotin transporter BioY n=1 Tax=Alkalicoccus chagannorensis TaxID=427072 RepID=UPI0004098EEA|nr:biotin transporter BioY [Alkalicoccus chagannorensis]